MRNDQKINSWLDTVVSGIRFGPDQQEVREELEAHIEDKMLDLQRIFPGMTEEEARERALAGMGDAEELKVSLTKIHTPWLGRLWTLACCIYGFTAFILLVLALFLGFEMWDWEARLSIKESLGSRETAWDREVLDRSVVLVPDGKKVVSDGCRLTMERAWLVEDPDGSWRVQVELLVRDHDLLVDDYRFVHKITAVDGEGTRYPELCGEELTQYTSCRRASVILPMLADPFTKRYILSVHGVDPDLKELRLEYDQWGRSFSMIILGKGAGL